MSLYLGFNVAATLSVLLYNLLHYNKKKLLLSEASQRAIKHFAAKQQSGFDKILSNAGFWTVIEIVIIFMLQYYISGVFNTIVGNILDTGANYFGMVFFAPLLVVAFCLIVKIDPLAQLDLITPAYPLALFFSKIACYFGGCCRGVEWEHGFYNPVSRLIEFPSQLLEAVAALLVFVFLLIVKSKAKKGTVFPIYLTAYSAIRFFTEFTRVEPEVFLGLKTYQILCIVGVAVGAIEYLAACKYSNSQKDNNQCHSQMKANRKARR